MAKQPRLDPATTNPTSQSEQTSVSVNVDTIGRNFMPRSRQRSPEANLFIAQESRGGAKPKEESTLSDPAQIFAPGAASWPAEPTPSGTILRDCSDLATSAARADATPSNTSNSGQSSKVVEQHNQDLPIQIDRPRSSDTPKDHHHRLNPGHSKRVAFKSLLGAVSPETEGAFCAPDSRLDSPLLEEDCDSDEQQEEILLERSQLTLNDNDQDDELDGQQFSLASSTRFAASNHNSGHLGRRVAAFLGGLAGSSSSSYTRTYEDRELLRGKYQLERRRRSLGRTFRGKYRYSRAEVSMAIFRKLLAFLFQRASLALLGAFLIHVTLGTVYTLSNVNSYLTSYMRLHGYPTATYGGSVWISSSYAVGQGFSMVLGGYLEKRFSARLSCSLGCALHSLSVAATSRALDHGPLAVLLTYGFLPGFGCGLAYMTPMSNGFGWFPHRKGLVAGVILAGFGIGTFVFNMAQTAYANPDNLSPPDGANGYFTQPAILERVPKLFVMLGAVYASMQFIGCLLLFKPPTSASLPTGGGKLASDERPILAEREPELSLRQALNTRQFLVLFVVYGLTTQGVLFVNSMLKEYGQLFISDDMYLAWVGSMASIANAAGRLAWGLAIDRFTFTQCFTAITTIFGALLFLMPHQFILSSKPLYLLCALGLFGSFSGWMSTYPVHLSRVFGRTNSGMVYGLIFVSQSCCGLLTALGSHYLIDHFNRFVPFFCMAFLELIGLCVYHLFYPK